MSQCQFQPCNQSAGHHGPHGIEIAPGLIAAPHGGDEGAIREEEPVDLRCNSCSAPMVMRRFEHGGASFRCTACEQHCSFFVGGRSEMRIMPRLYPSTMDERSAMYADFLDYRVSEVRFSTEARRLCGLISAEEARSQLADFDQKVAAKRAEIASAAPARPWWKFWQRHRHD